MSYSNDTIQWMSWGIDVPPPDPRVLVVFDLTYHELEPRTIEIERKRVEDMGYREVQVKVQRNWRNVGGYRYEYWGVRK